MVVGLSGDPTRYRVRVRGLDLFLRCGADILLSALDTDLEAEARCPTCERGIRFRVRDGHVEDLDPAGTRLHVVDVAEGQGQIRVLCEGTHLFDQEKCLAEGLGIYGGRRGATYTPQEYIDRWKGKVVRVRASSNR